MGRPPIEFDLKQVKMCGYFHATYETMADLFGCSVDTIRRNMQDDEGEFCKAFKTGNSQGKMKLSEAQWHCAITKHNATLLIWLGKQYLGQRDAPDTDIDDTDNQLTFEGWN